jgi:hypothetical protein
LNPILQQHLAKRQTPHPKYEDRRWFAMVSSSMPVRRRRFLIRVITILLITCAACAPKPDETSISLVWEIEVPGPVQLWWVGDNGEAWIRRRPELAAGVLDPLRHIDSRGQTIKEVDWAGTEARYDILSPELSRPLEGGWVAVDHAIGYVTRAHESGYSSWRIAFESLVKLIDEKGETRWETQGPANASLHYVDESIIICQGKDPSILDEVTLERRDPQYDSLVNEKYEARDNRIVVLDTKTGSERSSFDIPNTQFPDELIAAGMITGDGPEGKRLLSALEYREDAISKIIYYDLEDGSIKHSVDLRGILPDKRVEDVHHYREGLVALSDDGSVSVLTLEGRVLWTKRGLSISGVVCSTAEGLLMVEYFPSWEVRTSSVVVFDTKGDVILNVGGLRRVALAGASPRAFALSSSGRTGEDALYVFDLSGGTAKVSRALLPEVELYRVSPSGTYVLAQHSSPEGGVKVATYKLEDR